VQEIIMKRTTIAAALALLMTSGAAFAETQTQEDFAKDRIQNTIAMVMLVHFAGTHCPNVRMIEEAMIAELKDAGVTSETLNAQGMGIDMNILESMFLNHYDKDPTKFCTGALRGFGPNGGPGPNGAPKRQMLEAK
jgi:hypothetical protein